MPPRPVSPTRLVAREAVRRDLARVALGLFHTQGYDAVTLEDVATAAGASKSTVLRYFDSKEGLVLDAFRVDGAELASAARDAGPQEAPWAVLRRAADVVAAHVRADPRDARAVARLVQGTAALRAAQREERAAWAGQLADVLADRDPAVAADAPVWATAAMACLGIALERWARGGDDVTLDQELDAAFGAIGLRPLR